MDSCRNSLTSRCWPVLALVLCALPSPALAAKERIFAVVVGNNRSTDAKLPRLRYADDDAAKFYELMTELGGTARLLTVLDPASQARFGRLTARTAAPSRAALKAALSSTFTRIRAANAAGFRTIFYFIFSGHGSVSKGQGQLHFLDGNVSRGELLRMVVKPSPAKVNHLVIDACHAYFAVHAKGGWRDDRAKVKYAGLLTRFLRNESIGRYPNTGVLLATASSTETHEWSRIEAGLFSHQVRSALAGAADVGHDGAVSYSEVAAYISAANSKVKNRRAALSVFARPPAQNLAEPVVRLSTARPVHRLRMARSLSGHFYLEDRRSARYADFNKSGEKELSLVLVSAGQGYFLRTSRGEKRIELSPKPGTIKVASLDPKTVQARGSIAESLERGLYQVPYGPSFYSGYLSAWQRQLEEPLPALASEPALARQSAAPGGAHSWRLGLGYLMTTPALSRDGLAHGLELSVGYAPRPWLALGLGLQYAGASDDADTWKQHRIAALAFADAGVTLLPWLGLTARLDLGYLALLENVRGEDRGDPAAFCLTLRAGPEVRLHPRLFLSLKGGMVLDVLHQDGAASARVGPALWAGLGTSF